MSEFKNAASPDEMEQLNGEVLEAEFVEDQPEESEPCQEGIGSDACGALASSVFDLIAMRRGEHWRLKPEESQTVGASLDAVLQKYAPALGNVGPEASLFLVVFAVMVPRIQSDRATDET